MERQEGEIYEDDDDDDDGTFKTVWHAGDWTGPICLQPEKALSGESELSSTHDIVAISSQGVKVITVEYSSLHSILKSGSALYRTYLDRKAKKNYTGVPMCLQNTPSGHLYVEQVRNLEIMEIIEYNSTLRKISAVQKRHLESLAEGPIYYAPGERLWCTGTPVDKAFIVVGGTASFLAKRRNASAVGVRMEDDLHSAPLGEMMMKDAEKVREEDEGESAASCSSLSSHNIEDEETFEGFSQHASADLIVDNHDYTKLSMGLQRRADTLGSYRTTVTRPTKQEVESRRYSDSDRSELSDSVSGYDETSNDLELAEKTKKISFDRRRSSIDRNANKQLVRLYNRRAYTAGLVFSIGHFLGDISKMVAGLLSSDYNDLAYYEDDNSSAKYGFGEKHEENKNSRKIGETTIQEHEGDQPINHTSTLSAGKNGCVVLVFSKASLIPFFDEHPGLLLSLLGTQVVL